MYGKRRQRKEVKKVSQSLKLKEASLPLLLIRKCSADTDVWQRIQSVPVVILTLRVKGYQTPEQSTGSTKG